MRALLKFIPPGILLSICISIAGNTSADPGAGDDGPEERMHVYMLIGGEVMAGRAEIPEEDAQVIDRCYLLNGEGKWEPAKGALNRYSTIRNGDEPQGLGPGYGFAKAMLEADKNITIGLVVNAGGDSKIEDWTIKNEVYREARRRTLKQALGDGTLKGVLWHHNNTFSISPLSDIKDLVAELRSDSGLWNLPFIAGETADSPSMNSQLAALASGVHATGVASAEGLNAAKGGQFDAPGMKTIGERYAAEMLRVQRELAARGERKRPPETRFIDTHVHAMATKAGGLDPVARWMERAGIERCIVSPIGQSRAKTPEEREQMLANFRKYKGKIDRFCIIEPGEAGTVEEAVDILKKEIAEGAIGFGEHYGRDLMFDDPKNMLIYAACEKVGLPVMFHIDQNKNMDGEGLLRVERVLKAYPECILIAHAYWWLHLPDGSCDRLLQTYPNLYADVSGLRVAGVLNRDRKYTREFLIRNADRILFGSDAGWWNFKGDEAQFNLFEEFDLPDEVRQKIYRGNAARLFGFNKEK